MKTVVSGQFAAIRVGIPFFNFNKAKHIDSIRVTCNPYIYCTVLGISFKHPRMETNPKSFQTHPKFLEFSVVARSQAKKKNGIQEMFGIVWNVFGFVWLVFKVFWNLWFVPEFQTFQIILGYPSSIFSNVPKGSLRLRMLCNFVNDILQVCFCRAGRQKVNSGSCKSPGFIQILLWQESGIYSNFAMLIWTLVL